MSAEEIKYWLRRFEADLKELDDEPEETEDQRVLKKAMQDASRSMIEDLRRQLGEDKGQQCVLG